MPNDASPAATTKHVALDPVAAFFKRKADFMENEALLLSLQLRDELMRPREPAPSEPEDQG